MNSEYALISEGCGGQIESGIYTVFRCETSREHSDFCTRVAPSAL